MLDELSKILNEKDKFVLVSIEGATQEDVNSILERIRYRGYKANEDYGFLLVGGNWVHYKSNIKDFNISKFVQWCKDKGVISK